MATTAAEPVFIDTNVLNYSRQSLSPFHAAAVAKLAHLKAAGHELWISRQTLREYLASMSRPGALTGTVSMSALVADVQAFATIFRVAEDGAAVTSELLRILSSIAVAGKQIHDANIVATMRTYGITRLLTNNVGDFNRYISLIAVEPLVP
jgi:predicted nucleic acid-binding protein